MTRAARAKLVDTIGPLCERLTKAVALELLHADEPGRTLVAIVLEELAAELRDQTGQTLWSTLV